MMERRQQSGFSMIELMIALVILAVVTSGVLAVFSSQQQHYIGNKRMLDTQGDARLAIDVIFMDIRMAGFMIPTVAGIATGDGGSGGADRLCSSDYTIISDAILEDATARFDGGSFTNDLSNGEDSISITAAERDIDGNGSADFSLGGGIIIADGTKSHCARITAMSATAIQFTPPTPNAFAAAALTGVAVPAIVYEISGSMINRNSFQLSPQVEDLQIEFAVDANDDGRIDTGEFPIHDLDGFNPAQIRAVRVSVLMRTTVEEEALADTGGRRQAVANRAAATVTDAFRRRLATVIAAPRNIL
jgi:prepilin-type N-terminal cleavage/methylation domain-containing protein